MEWQAWLIDGLILTFASLAWIEIYKSDKK